MNCELEKSPGNSSEHSQNIHTASPILKKTSPLKHVTPIIKKYNCQRQAKNGKSVKLKPHTNKLDEEPTPQTNLPVILAGMDSLDAALRRAEKCMAGSKDHPDDRGFEASADEVVDGEEEGISSNAASNQHNPVTNRSPHPRARNRVLKKRNQLQKDLEHALPLAISDQLLMNEERSQNYAASFLFKVKERYEASDNTIYNKFFEIFEEFGKSFYSPTDLYYKVINILRGSPDLCEDFLLILSPNQALRCGKFMEYLALLEMSSFIQKLELYFAKQPQHLKKIYATLARLSTTPDLHLETVRSTVLPLLRGNSFLVDSFLELLPSERPPESKMTDYDLLSCEDLDGEHSGEDETFERLEIPPENDDQYGGENCQCCCHSTSADPAIINCVKHCTACGIKFISGKVFMQTENGLRPARIVFSGNGSTSNNIKRLNAGHQKLSRSRSRRGRISTSQILLKTEECKPNAETDDEAVLASKIKSPRQRPKISKPNREKPPSAKSLAPNYTSCSRKPAVSSLNFPSMPVIHNQGGIIVPVSSPNADEKPSGLNFSSLSNFQDVNEKKDLSVNKVVLPQNMVSGCQVPKEEIKEECRMEVDTIQIMELKTANSESVNTEIIKESVNDVKAEDSNDVTTDGKDQRAEGIADDNNGESNIDVSGASSMCNTDLPSDEQKGLTWTRDEDRIILCTFQSEPDREKTLSKISAQLPHRTINEISSRFQLLINLIQKLR